MNFDLDEMSYDKFYHYPKIYIYILKMKMCEVASKENGKEEEVQHQPKLAKRRNIFFFFRSGEN